MDAIFSLVSYVFRKNMSLVEASSLESFFDDGTSFPFFISLIFDGENIPNINREPKTSAQKKQNNEIALQFLIENNEEIRKNNPSIKSKSDKCNLILLILSKQVFQISNQNIIETSNIILRNIGKSINNVDEIQNIGFLISILHVLTNGDVQIPDEDHEITDIQSELENILYQSNVSLNIDQSSFDENNLNLYLIQIHIIFQTFSKKINKLRKKQLGQDDDESSEEQINNIYASHDRQEDEKNEDDLLLMAINAIGSKGGFKFDNFYQTIKNDSLPKFVMFYFGIQSIENVSLEKSTESQKHLSDNEIKNIEAVIEFVKKKDKIFEILIFNFKKHSFQKPSAILFYRNFLNIFFLKASRKEIFERCSAILCTNFELTYDEFMLPLIDDQIIVAILHFVLNGNFKYPNDIFLSTIRKYCDKLKIPMLISNQINMEYKYSRLPDSIFYLYQFIFDRLDSGPKSYQISEKILTGLKKIQNVHVPKYEAMVINIKAKMKSVEFQKEGIDEYQKRMNRNANKNNDKKVLNKMKNIKEPISINDRKTSYTEKYKIELINQEKIILDAYKIWNPETSYSFENGILFEQNKKSNIKSEKDWTNAVSSLFKKENKKNVIRNELLFCLEKKKEDKSNLYKFFSFDCEKNKWFENINECTRCLDEQDIDIHESKVPIVLFLNSFQNDSIKICSHFINGKYPDLDEFKESIFVYGFCEKSLSYLNYQIDKNSKKKSQIYPLFLFLNVPENKKNIPNIKSVVTQIYAYLCLICDLEIVVLDKNYYLDQIEFMKILDKITHFEDKNKKSIKKKKSIDESSSNDENENDDDDDDDFPYGDDESDNDFHYGYESDDDFRYGNDNCDDDYRNDRYGYGMYGDENDEKNDDKSDDDEEDIDDDSTNYQENYKKNYIDYNPLKLKNSSLIVLFNDQLVNSNESYESEINKSKFFSNIKSQIPNISKMHFINVDNPNTYQSFLNSINELIVNSTSTKANIIDNFKKSKLINQISEKFVQLKSSTQWKDELKLFLQQRYTSIETINEKTLFILFILKEEINYYLPIFDKDFSNECKMFILNKKSEYIEKNRNVLIDELKTSSKLKLNELESKIGESLYWNKNQIDIITNSHIQFLKNEFFSIIKMFFDEKMQAMIYSENIGILNDKIEEDKKKVMKMFKSYIEKIQIKESIKEQNFQEGSSKRTNYSLKETENIREIKVTVKMSEDLKSEIEQDF